jgi:hypothetical protein
VKEVNSFRGIPYADYFNVLTEWQIVENKNDPKGSIVHIYLDFKFHKSTWLQGTIESNTKAELLEVFDLWLEAVNHQIRLEMDNTRRASTASTTELQKLNVPPSKSISKDIENQEESQEQEQEYDDYGGKDCFFETECINLVFLSLFYFL